MSDPTTDLPAALELLRKAVDKPGNLDRHLVRAVLLPLGALLIHPGDEDQDAILTEIRELVEPAEKAWREALEFELKLAASEHIQSVDLRYLSRPDYDFEYTMRARERLEARLAAAEALGWPADAELLQRVQRADATLEPFLGSREGREPLN
jgi:hypothetical protein